VYEVPLPHPYSEFKLPDLYIILGEFVKCLGSFRTTLLVQALSPLALIVCVCSGFAISTFVTHRLEGRKGSIFERRVLKDAALAGLPWSLYICYFLIPSLSVKLFASFNCVSFEYERGHTLRFLRGDYSTTCDISEEHFTIRRTAFIFVCIWPVGVTIAFGVLLYYSRNAIKQQKPTRLSRATSFLHSEFDAKFFYWEVVILVQRILLTGALLLIPHSKQLIRLITALFIAALSSMLTPLFNPYKRRVHNNLSAGMQAALLCFFLGALCVKLFSDLSTQWTEQNAKAVLGFDSPEQILSVIFGFAFSVAVFVILGLFQQLAADQKVKTLRIEGGAMPELTLNKDHMYHLFLSHIWASGQVITKPEWRVVAAAPVFSRRRAPALLSRRDNNLARAQDQVAVVKRRLQQLLPGCSIFL
jgi:hypothetical protein